MTEKNEKPLIRVDHIRKVFRMGQEKVVALDDVSLDIRKGEMVCFLGTSGSGKSTFLNMVAGLEKPTRGEIWVGNIPIQHDGAGKCQHTPDLSGRG
jgi:putative ABC transport system ATP-binding protein